MRAAVACVLGLLLGQFACIIGLAVAMISLAENQRAVVELHLRMEQEETAKVNKRLDEFQAWRVQVTLASRMGWSDAVRFIREHPLVYGENP